MSRVFRYNRAQPRPNGRWHPRVKDCRIAARVKLCVHTRWHCSNASRGLPTHNKMNDVLSVPQFLGHNIPIYEEGALISALTAVIMRECCRKIPPRIFPQFSWWAYVYSYGKTKVSNYIAGIIPIGPGRRYTLSIYSTTTPFFYDSIDQKRQNSTLQAACGTSIRGVSRSTIAPPIFL